MDKEKVKRKINYYKITLKSGNDSRPYVKGAINQLIEYKESSSPRRFNRTSTGPEIEFLDILQKGEDFWYLKSIAIRSEFPEVYDRATGDLEAMDEEEDENKNIPDVTHSVIYQGQKSESPVLAIESTLKGPKLRDIEFFMNRLLLNIGVKDDLFDFEPVFAFNLSKLIERIDDDVAKLSILVHQDQIEAIRGHDRFTAEMLESMRDYGQSEYIQAEFSIYANRKKEDFPRRGLAQNIWRLIRIFHEKPEAKLDFKKVDIKARDRESGNELRLFDLLEQKVASEVVAERKRTRSRDYDSRKLYEAIREKMVGEFRLGTAH